MLDLYAVGTIMTYTNASLDNIRKSVFKNVRTVIVGNVTDVDTRVYGAFPIKNTTYPIIVIESPLKTIDDDSKYFNSSEYSTVNINISIYAKQVEKLDTYADSVDKLLRDAELTFKTYKMEMTDDSPMDVDTNTFQDDNNQRVHSKTISVMFEIDK